MSIRYLLLELVLSMVIYVQILVTLMISDPPPLGSIMFMQMHLMDPQEL